MKRESLSILFLAFSLLSAAQITHTENSLAVSSSVSHYHGEFYGGGVIFLTDSTGSHGLICSMQDIASGAEWCNWIGQTGKLIGAEAQNDWDGMTNSIAIVNQYGHLNSAAKLCLDYTNTDYGTGVYSDWYLPGQKELEKLYQNLNPVQEALENDGNEETIGISKTYYWSSSEYSGYFAWVVYFQPDHPYNIFYNSKQDQFRVRAIRQF